MKAMGPLEASGEVLLDAEGLLKEEGYGALLVVQPVFQGTCLVGWNDRKKGGTPGRRKEKPHCYKNE